MSNIIANTTRQHISDSTLEYRWNASSVAGATVFFQQSRRVRTDGWRCMVDAVAYPSTLIGSGDELKTQRTTPQANRYYLYEEIWLTYTAWSPGSSTATSTTT
jgi:hypothetical protein